MLVPERPRLLFVLHYERVSGAAALLLLLRFGPPEDVPGAEQAPEESAPDEGAGCGCVVLGEVGLRAVGGRVRLLGGGGLVAPREGVVVNSKNSAEAARGAGTGGEGVDVGVRV